MKEEILPDIHAHSIGETLKYVYETFGMVDFYYFSGMFLNVLAGHIVYGRYGLAPTIARLVEKGDFERIDDILCVKSVLEHNLLFFCLVLLLLRYYRLLFSRLLLGHKWFQLFD